MADEEKDEVTEETNDETEDNDVREEETKDEIRDNVYSHDDEIEMLRTVEKRMSQMEDKMDNIMAMFVDSGSIVQESIDTVSEREREDYEDDFINIDEMDLSL